MLFTAFQGKTVQAESGQIKGGGRQGERPDPRGQLPSPGDGQTDRVLRHLTDPGR